MEYGEFCQLETFEPECWKNELIVIEKAIYGRHRVGKCIKADEAAISQDRRFFGCSTDVIGLLDAKCSGRKRCQVRIPDADLERTEPCLSILKMFLEVSYRCVEGKIITCDQPGGGYNYDFTSIRLLFDCPFNCDSTALRAFDGHIMTAGLSTFCGLLHCGLNK